MTQQSNPPGDLGSNAGLGVSVERACTCHPDDKPLIPCAQQYALGACRAYAAAYWQGYDAALNDCLRNGMQWAIAQFDSAAPDPRAAYLAAQREDERRAEWHAEMRRDAFGA